MLQLRLPARCVCRFSRPWLRLVLCGLSFPNIDTGAARLRCVLFLSVSALFTPACPPSSQGHVSVFFRAGAEQVDHWPAQGRAHCKVCRGEVVVRRGGSLLARRRLLPVPIYSLKCADGCANKTSCVYCKRKVGTRRREKRRRSASRRHARRAKRRVGPPSHVLQVSNEGQKALFVGTARVALESRRRERDVRCHATRIEKGGGRGRQCRAAVAGGDFGAGGNAP